MSRKVFWLFIAALQVAVLVACYAEWQRQREMLKKDLKVDFDEVRIASYDRGFRDGASAVLNHVYWDTNSQRIIIQMTNVLSEMKP